MISIWMLSPGMHLNAFRQCDIAGYVCGSEIELGPVAVEEWGMPSALFLLQYIDL
ncbi:hypothetical protein MASR2M70_10150 [Bacillota bacterium]